MQQHKPNCVTIAAPFGAIEICLQHGALFELSLLADNTAPSPLLDAQSSAFAQQFNAWLLDPTFVFSLTLCPRGTAFQQRVWQEIRQIPTGHTRSYGELATVLNSSARAVGQACAANPFPILTPCHRVTTKTGLGGFVHTRDGPMLNIKQWLLNHEVKR